MELIEVNLTERGVTVDLGLEGLQLESALTCVFCSKELSSNVENGQSIVLEHLENSHFIAFNRNWLANLIFFLYLQSVHKSKKHSGSASPCQKDDSNTKRTSKTRSESKSISDSPTVNGEKKTRDKELKGNVSEICFNDSVEILTAQSDDDVDNVAVSLDSEEEDEPSSSFHQLVQKFKSLRQKKRLSAESSKVRQGSTEEKEEDVDSEAEVEEDVDFEAEDEENVDSEAEQEERRPKKVVTPNLKRSETATKQTKANRGRESVESAVSTSDRAKPNPTKAVATERPNVCDVKEFCRARCEICPLELNYDMIDFHLTRTHNTTRKAYEEKYGKIGMIEKKIHRCTICGVAFIWTRMFLKTHLTKHAVDLKTYLENLKESSKRKDSSESSASSNKRMRIEDTDDEYVDDPKDVPEIQSIEIISLTEEVEKLKEEVGSCSEQDQPSIKYNNNRGDKEESKAKISKVKDNDEDKQYSDDLSVSCEFRCIACQFVGQYRPFLEHIKENHGGTADYKKEHGKYAYQKKVYHRCNICSEDVLCHKDAIVSHLNRKHDKLTYRHYRKKFAQNTDIIQDTESGSASSDDVATIKEEEDKKEKREEVENNISTPDDIVEEAQIVLDNLEESGQSTDQKIISNDFSVSSIYTCHECNFNGGYRELLKHISSCHSKPSAYKQKYGEYKFLKKVYHVCFLCSKEIIFHRDSVISHVRSRHKMTHQEYRMKYIRGSEEVAIAAKFVDKRNGKVMKNIETKKDDAPIVNESKKDVLIDEKQEKNESTEGFSAHDLLSSKHSSRTSPQRDKEQEEAKTEMKEEVVDRSWYDGNTFSCTLCDFSTRNLDKVRTHIKTTHKIKSKNVIEKKYNSTENMFQCNFCEAELLHEKNAILPHLEEHCLDLKLYEKLYLKHTKIREENAYRRENEEDSVDVHGNGAHDTTRDSVHINWLNQADQSASSSDEGIKHLKSSIKSSVLRMCSSTSSDASDWFTDDESEDSDSESAWNFQILDPKIQSPILPLVKAEEIDCRVDDNLGKERDTNLYMCPLCTFQTRLEGLKDGTASEHLLVSHNMHYVRFKKEGIRWKRMSVETALSEMYHMELD